MAEVHVLPGVERRDLIGTLPANQLLQGAIDAGVTDVIIVGRDRSGAPYVASGLPDADKAVGMLMRAVNMIAGATIENDQVLGDDGGPSPAG